MSTLIDHVIVQVVLPRTTGLPADVVVNNWHFKKQSGSSFADAAAEVAPIVQHFYDTKTGTQSQKIGTYIGSAIDRGTNWLTKTYDGSVAPGSRIPIQDTFAGPTSGSSSSLPAEVAYCLSFRSFFTLAPLSHQRGRIYLGPFNDFARASGTTLGDSRPDGTMQGDILDAAQQVGAEVAASTHINAWCTYSPTSNVLFPIGEIFVDDAWDTQRRRGVAPGTRTVRTL